MERPDSAVFNENLGIFTLSHPIIILTKNYNVVIGYYNKNEDVFYKIIEDFKMEPIDVENILGWDDIDLKKIIDRIKVKHGLSDDM